MNGARLLPLLGLLLAISYPFYPVAMVPAAVGIAWKGACVAMLALWAVNEARDPDGWLLAAVMALGSLGDMLIEISFTFGALAFMAGHAVAILLYLRNRRDALSSSQRALGLLIVPVTVLLAFRLPADRASAPGVAVYALFLGAMAAAAWTSRFPRYRVGLGAMLFVASDLLIFARMGPLVGSALPRLGIWPFYFAGQLLICTGVIGVLRARRASS